MEQRTCAGCGELFLVKPYRLLRTRCPPCADILYDINARARGRDPAALRKEALKGFIGPKWPYGRKPKKPMYRVVPNDPGLKHCYSCYKTKRVEEFYISPSGKVYFTCKPCRLDAALKARQHRDGPLGKGARKTRNRYLRNRFGITIDDYERMNTAQGGLCKICLEAESRILDGKLTGLSVDHCHKTGKIRGLLCSDCNKALGMFGDDPATMLRAIHYLENPEEWPGHVVPKLT